MILNDKYYNDLINKYSIRQDCNKLAMLSASLIMSNYSSRNVHFNFPKEYNLHEIINILYEQLSIQVFNTYAEITDFSVGERLMRRNEKGRSVYVITEINGNIYHLIKENDISNLKIEAKFDSLKKYYYRTLKDTRNAPLSKFGDFFKEYNEYGFLPTHFSKKIVLIAGQTIWNNLKNRNCIPTTYLPNTRDGSQTKRKSIEAIEDSIVYITPKYEVCYTEILKNNIAVDTIIVCDTDISSIPQILQDKEIYNFKLIVLSNDDEIQRYNNITLWNWQQEEIGLIEEMPDNSVDINCIKDDGFNAQISHFEDCVEYVSSLDVPIKLNSYGYFLRLALNALQKEQFNYLLMRLNNNKELEHNEGGYEGFGENNPKEALKNLISYLKEANPKLNALNEIISSTAKRTLYVVDREDVELLKKSKNKNCQFITQKELKEFIKNGKINTKPIVFYTFNGSKDFDLISNLPNSVQLVLYEQEKELYFKQLQIHTNQLETELASEDRYKMCNLRYAPVVKRDVKVSKTLEQIIERLEQRSNTAYDGYKDESDSLLDDLEEEITYRIALSNNDSVQMGSNETVFNDRGNLIKSYRLKVGGKIRIYPKEQLAENLFQIAVEVEPGKFGIIDEHAAVWLNSLKDLDRQMVNREQLYSKLKENGLRVLPATIDAYFRGQRKFPMFDTDLRAILKVAGKELLYVQIKKSKRLYNSTMIALGRGVKQELKLFLKEKTVGEILQKKSFTKETLQKFIDEFMPLLTVTKIEEVSDEQ